MTPGRQPGSARSSLSSVRSSASSMKSPSASARPTPIQIGADIRGTTCTLTQFIVQIIKSIVTKIVNIEYSKTCLKRPLKNRQNNDLETIGSFMKVKSFAECSLGAFCNTFDLH